jgi:hypothetical protein
MMSKHFVVVYPRLRLETRVVVLLMIRFANIPSIHSLLLPCVTDCLLFRTLQTTSACALFKADAKFHKNFPYMHCWKILKDQPKWIERCKHMNIPKTAAKKEKTSAKSSPSSTIVPNTTGDADDGQPSQNTLERPSAKKKEKQKLRQCSTLEALMYLMLKKKQADVEKDLKKDERCKNAVVLQEEMIRIEREKVEIKRELEEDRIMHMYMNTLSYKQQQYLERRQDEILAKRLNN